MLCELGRQLEALEEGLHGLLDSSCQQRPRPPVRRVCRLTCGRLSHRAASGARGPIFICLWGSCVSDTWPVLTGC